MALSSLRRRALLSFAFAFISVVVGRALVAYKRRQEFPSWNRRDTALLDNDHAPYESKTSETRSPLYRRYVHRTNLARLIDRTQREFNTTNVQKTSFFLSSLKIETFQERPLARLVEICDNFGHAEWKKTKDHLKACRALKKRNCRYWKSLRGT